MYEGACVAIVTPFKNDKVDEESLRKLVEFQIENGTKGIIPCGTTGESATLTYEEHCKVIDIVIDQTKKRIPVIAGTGSNSTHETVYLTEHARKAGADAALIIAPYYNKPTQKGLFEHYKYIAENVDLPLIIYNIPGRTACNILPDTIINLSHIKNIIGVKEASLSLDQAAKIIKNTPDDFCLLSGEDSLTFPLLCLGANGVISVASNVVPAKMAQMCEYIKANDFINARKIHYELLDLFKVLFLETNPIPVKKAMYLMGLIEDEIRLPLTPLSEDNTKILKDVLHSLKINTVN